MLYPYWIKQHLTCLLFCKHSSTHIFLLYSLTVLSLMLNVLSNHSRYAIKSCFWDSGKQLHKMYKSLCCAVYELSSASAIDVNILPWSCICSNNRSLLDWTFSLSVSCLLVVHKQTVVLTLKGRRHNILRMHKGNFEKMLLFFFPFLFGVYSTSKKALHKEQILPF